MRRITPYILWLWMGSLLTATTGISIHRIYCFCKGEAAVSFFKPADGCSVIKKEAKVPEEDCAATAPDCCLKKKFAVLHKKEDHKCTDTTTQYYHLKSDFLLEKSTLKTFDFPLWLPEWPNFRQWTKTKICRLPDTNKAPPDIGPPLSGRVICIRQQRFRC